MYGYISGDNCTRNRGNREWGIGIGKIDILYNTIINQSIISIRIIEANTTDKTCVAESDDFSINDFMQDDYGYGYLLPGTGTFMSIEANDDITSIDDVTNASIKFEVRDYDSYETFYSSDELTFISNN